MNNGSLDVVKFLVEKGVDINATSLDGRTPLHFAASNGNFEVVEVLVTGGADITC